MTSIQKAQLEFLNETVEFYTNNERCVNENNACKYYLEGKAGCAIGRKIEDIELRKSLDKTRAGGTTVDNDSVFEMLPESLRELGQNFLSSIQWLHDCVNFWNNQHGIGGGLTLAGKNYVAEIKTKFGLI